MKVSAGIAGVSPAFNRTGRQGGLQAGRLRSQGGKVLLVILWVTLAWASVPAQQPPGPSSPLYGARPEAGAVSSGLPTALKDVKIEQKLNQQLPLDLTFRDETGQTVKLGQYFGQRPVVVSLVYYDCPMLCTQVLNGMLESIRVLP